MTISIAIRNLAQMLAVVLTVAACGSGDSPTGDGSNPTVIEVGGLDATRPPAHLAEAKWFYRLDLSRSSAGAVTLDEVTRVFTDLQPTPSLQAEYLAVAYAGPQVRTAHPIAFPRIAHSTEPDLAGGWAHTEVTLAGSTESVFVDGDEAVDRVVLLDRDGAAVVELAAADLPGPPLPSPGRRPLEEPLGQTQQALTRADLALRYPHLRFLAAGPNAEPRLPAELRDGVTVVSPPPVLTDVLASVLEGLTPPLLASVRTVAWVTYASGHRDARSYARATGSTIMINSGRAGTESELKAAVAHEITHCFTFASDAVATASPKKANWPADVQVAAEEKIRQFGLSGGIANVWFRVQDTGVIAKRAGRYLGPDERAWSVLSPEQATKAGFASPYGSADQYEDIAEYLGYLLYPSTNGSTICQLFDGKTSVDLESAVVYTKLVLLLAVGAIRDADFDRCVQAAKLVAKSGVEFPDGITFAQNLKAGWADDHGLPYFDVLGDGPNTSRLLLQVGLPSKKASPLGLHRLDGVWLGNVGATVTSAAFLSNDDPFLARASAEGMILVTKVGVQGTEGAVFGLVLQNALAIDREHWPLGTFRIPP